MLLLNMSLDCYNDPFSIITVLIFFSYDYGIGEIKFISVRGRKCADARRPIKEFTGVYGEKCADAV